MKLEYQILEQLRYTMGLKFETYVFDAFISSTKLFISITNHVHLQRQKCSSPAQNPSVFGVVNAWESTETVKVIRFELHTRQKWKNARGLPYICCVILQMSDSFLVSFYLMPCFYPFSGLSQLELKFFLETSSLPTRSSFPGWQSLFGASCCGLD